MHLEIALLSFANSEPLRRHIRRRVAQAVGRFDRRVARVAVRLADENGPRGGVDQRCGIEVHLHHGPMIRLRETCEDAYSAVDRAAARLRRALSRQMDRRRGRRVREWGQRIGQSLLRPGLAMG